MADRHGCSLVILTVLLTAKPLYQQIKSWRANWLIRDIQYQYYSHQDLENVKTALRLAPNNLNVLKVAAQFHFRINPINGKNLWDRILAHPDATSEDYSDFLNLLKGTGHTFLFAPHANTLKASPRDEALSRVLASY